MNLQDYLKAHQEANGREYVPGTALFAVTDVPPPLRLRRDIIIRTQRPEVEVTTETTELSADTEISVPTYPFRRMVIHGMSFDFLEADDMAPRPVTDEEVQLVLDELTVTSSVPEAAVRRALEAVEKHRAEQR